MSTDVISVVIISLTHTWLVKSLWLLLSCDLSSLTDNRSAVPYGCSLSLGRFEQDSDSCRSFIQEGLLTIVLVYCRSWRENTRLHKWSSNLLLSKCDIKKVFESTAHIKMYFSTWDISCHIERGCRTKPFRGWCSYRHLVCDTWVELRKHVMGGVWRQWHCEPWSLQRHRRVKRMHATVADLSWIRDRETIFYFIFFTCFQSIAVLSLATTTAANDSTSYCIMTPLGSVGSFQERLIVSSDGVALSDWLGTGPGTVNTHKFMQF